MRAHADDLRAEVEDDKLVDAVVHDVHSAPLERISDRAAALVRHAEKLTRDPASINDGDIEALRTSGCDDRAIADLTQVASLFNYYNRIADGLGIDPEPDWD